MVALRSRLWHRRVAERLTPAGPHAFEANLVKGPCVTQCARPTNLDPEPLSGQARKSVRASSHARGWSMWAMWPASSMITARAEGISSNTTR
jgi:hypothetical protein